MQTRDAIALKEIEEDAATNYNSFMRLVRLGLAEEDVSVFVTDKQAHAICARIDELITALGPRFWYGKGRVKSNSKRKVKLARRAMAEMDRLRPLIGQSLTDTGRAALDAWRNRQGSSNGR